MSNRNAFFLLWNSILLNLIYISFFVNINTVTSENSQKIIVIPFKTYHPKVHSDKETKQTNLLRSWLRQKIYLNIENSNGQQLSMILTLEQINSHSKEDIALITSEENNLKLYKQNVDDLCFFNHKNSPNFKCQTPNNIFLYDDREKCCVVEEKLIFYNDEALSEKHVYPFKFIHSTNQDNICFFSSLQQNIKEVDKTKSFIEQLKALTGAKTYTWILKYTSVDSGLFIFGDIVDNDKVKIDNKNHVKNIEQNYDSIYSKNVFNHKLFWKINADRLIFDDVVFGENENADIDINIPFILLKKPYYRKIKEKLFNKFFEEKICDKNIPEFKLSAVSCNKNKFLERTNNLKNLPSLTFQLKQYNLNLTFTPNDLFVIEGDDIYFMIAHHSYKDRDCTIGSILLKKYNIIFDDDAKLMKILKSSNYSENDENKGGNGGKIYLIMFLLVIASGIIFGFIGLKYGKKIYQARRKKANELDDNYDYNQYNGKNDINFDKKYGLFSNSENNSNDMNLKGVSLEMTKS